MSSGTIPKRPPEFLQLIVHSPIAEWIEESSAHVVGLSGLCAGFEETQWRCEQLVQHLFDHWLLSFALRHSELTTVDAFNAGELMRRAARAVYQTQRFERRGELGELLLHVAISQVFDASPAISKIYFKDTPNAAIHGFDAVHVVPSGSELELWLGEAKFYTDPGEAIRSAVTSLTAHRNSNYLRNEFAAIVNKIDPSWPYAARLSALLNPATSLDTIFHSICLPVLITYDSEVLASHTMLDDMYRQAVASEWEAIHSEFAARELPRNLKVHLFLIPLATKKALIEAFDKKLQQWQ